MYYTWLPKIKVVMGKHVRKIDEEVTWNFTCPKYNCVWWSLRFYSERTQIGCLDRK